MMIELVQNCTKELTVSYWQEEEHKLEELPEAVRKLFKGEYLKTFWSADSDGKARLFVGAGKAGGEKIHLKELGSKAVKDCREKKIYEFAVDISNLVEEYGVEAIRHITEGLYLGTYIQRQFKEREAEPFDIQLVLRDGEFWSQAEAIFEETIVVCEGICFARDMVNLPGNHLRPEDFAEAVVDFVRDTGIQAQVMDEKELAERGMDALLGVGDSSAYPPRLVVLRYQGDQDSDRVTGLIGKGVTCDTGGYCLKPANSMLGIKGDMAGGAAVSAAIYAMAKNKVKANAVAVIPMCENRISRGSLLPGDVIRSYAGKTIEIANTDAEGRLILADAVSYAVREEKVTEVLDIATLTGAVVNMFGFTIAGAVCDNEDLYRRFEKAYECSGERYWRIPFYEEHEKMIESKIADIRNLSSGGCGTITAGLFIRAFAQEKPWLHLDIAGTAWVDDPVFQFQSAGATGAGVSTIYEFCRK